MERLTQTKIFLDGGDPAETRKANQMLKKRGYGELDGQTTNPTLVARNPDIYKRVSRGKKMTEKELLESYKQIVQGIDENGGGEISIEVYADKKSKAEDLVKQARQMSSWSDLAVIKLPITRVGLEAAELLKKEVRLNMTLCFSQSQAAAVYAATIDSSWPVYVSPFVGRLDDIGQNGMNLVENIIKMYRQGDSHVKVLAASLRSLNHVMGCLQLGVDAVTLPFEKTFYPWARGGFVLPGVAYDYNFKGEDIEYENVKLDMSWSDYDIGHRLTETGLDKFVSDWKSLIVNDLG